MDQPINIRDVAKSPGLTSQTIRFYEQLGLIGKPQWTSAGYRLYSTETLKRGEFTKDAQRLGFSLEEIREVLRLKYSRQSPCECVRKMLNGKLREIKDQIKQMDQMRRGIATCLRISRKRARLPHTASLICPIVQNKAGLSTAQDDSR